VDYKQQFVDPERTREKRRPILDCPYIRHRGISLSNIGRRCVRRTAL